ncbi:MAG TPA: thiamine phosphate synthase [Candidatus Dormibacteraeota bacterium]|jgi:thiamine-phosphate pyrophosphorylase|nr:thiamine phosphate synthase [Candidatus Dormibacteraeota bacterium]
MSMSIARLARVRLYVVTAAEDPPERVLATVGAACEAGAEAVQLRRKGEDARLVLRLAERCRTLVPEGGPTLLVVNDRIDIALAAGADGVHLGQDDLPLAAARRIWPQGLLGRSTHSLAQALAAESEGADYIGVGPVWATPTKPGRPAVGLELVSAVAAARLRIPWVAIGGVDAGNVAEVLAAGAAAVAVVRAVTAAADPVAAARRLHDAIRAGVAA